MSVEKKKETVSNDDKGSQGERKRLTLAALFDYLERSGSGRVKRADEKEKRKQKFRDASVLSSGSR